MIWNVGMQKIKPFHPWMKVHEATFLCLQHVAIVTVTLSLYRDNIVTTCDHHNCHLYNYPDNIITNMWPL